MKTAIGDHAAITFAAAFYQAIEFGRSVKVAFESGKAALMLEGILEEKTPELLVRKGVDAATVFLVQPTRSIPDSGDALPVNLMGVAQKPASVSNFAESIARLNTTGVIREAILRVTSQKDFPVWMSISDKLVRNPIWEKTSPKRRQQMTERHKLDGLTAPTIMHLV